MAAANKARGGDEGREQSTTTAPKHVHLVEEPIGEGCGAGVAGQVDGADVPARAGAHRAPRAHAPRAARPGPGHVAAGHRAGHRRRVRREGAADARGRRGVRGGRRPRPVGQVDRGPQRAPAVGGQAREETLEVEAAVRDDGTMLGMRVRPHLDHGAYPAFPSARRCYPMIIRVMMPGPYRLPALRVRHQIVASNKGTYVAYRGPWAVETWVRERMLDVIARELGHRPRRDPAPQHGRRPTSCRGRWSPGPTLDVRMSARTTLETRARDRRPRRRGRASRPRPGPRAGCSGIGFATFIEAAPGPPDFQRARSCRAGRRFLAGEPARPCSRPTARCASTPSRCPTARATRRRSPRSPPTSSACRSSRCGVRYGDTAITPFGLIRHRRQPVGGDGRRRGHVSARELRRQIVDVAADLLEAARRHRDHRRRHPRRRRPVGLGVVRRRRRRPRPGEPLREATVSAATTAARADGPRPPTCAGSRSTSRPGS